MTHTREMIVGKVDNQGDRVLLYPQQQTYSHIEYYVIAKVDCDAKVGDTIVYEPYGVNFGWFVRVEKRA